ncbi:MAG: YidC/Oxa1 family membrane protein insertase [Actinomycetota bacterium]
MIAEIAFFQTILDGLGTVLAKIYDVVGNYGLTIIIFTLLVRLLLVPIGIKQVKGMMAMQRLQPKMKAIQKKYKGNKEKQREETMKLYQEHGVNPLQSCLPLVLQIPVFIALYAVLQPPVPGTGVDVHIPEDSGLYTAVVETQGGTSFLTMNLFCTPVQAGDPDAPVPSTAKLAAAVDSSQTTIPVEEKTSPPALPFTMKVDEEQMQVSARAPADQAKGTPVTYTVARGADSTVAAAHEDGATGTSQLLTLDCGDGAAAKIPYYALLVLMVGTTYFQSRQMQKASPAAVNKQQQTITKIMPLFFGFIGINFPMGLILYWTTSNAWQVGQQFVLLKRMQAHEPPPPPEKPSKKASGGKPSGSKPSGAKDGGSNGGGSKGTGRSAKQRDQGSGKPAGPAKASKPSKPAKKGFMQRMLEQAEAERARKLKEEGTPDGGDGNGERGNDGKRDDSGGSSGGS